MFFGVLFGLALAYIAYQYFKGKNTGGNSKLGGSKGFW